MDPNKAEKQRPMALDLDMNNGLRAALAGSDNPVARYVAEHGTEWDGDEVSIEVTGPMGFCYSNAREYILTHFGESLRYVEGWVEDDERAIRHGWVDRDGEAIEVTWPYPGTSYVGVVFDVFPMRRTHLSQSITEEWVTVGDRTDTRRIQRAESSPHIADWIVPSGLTHMITGSLEYKPGLRQGQTHCGMSVAHWVDPFTDDDCGPQMCKRCARSIHAL
jgi:hypothetical protein